MLSQKGRRFATGKFVRRVPWTFETGRFRIREVLLLRLCARHAQTGKRFGQTWALRPPGTWKTVPTHRSCSAHSARIQLVVSPKMDRYRPTRTSARQIGCALSQACDVVGTVWRHLWVSSGHSSSFLIYYLPQAVSYGPQNSAARLNDSKLFNINVLRGEISRFWVLFSGVIWRHKSPRAPSSFDQIAPHTRWVPEQWWP
jgi:hypothetical protein